MNTIKIYCDTGTNFKFLRQNCGPNVELYQYPYDSPDRPKKIKIKLAIPSELTWEHAHSTLGESNFTFEDCCKSDKYDLISNLIGKKNNIDALHLDSAYKTNCQIFVTSDSDIYSKKFELEALCKFKIFRHTEKNNIIDYIKNILK